MDNVEPAILSLSQPADKVRRGYTSLRAINPRTGDTWELLLSDDKYRRTALRGMGAARELAFTVREGLLKPTAIFLGVRDVDRDISDDGWLCYVVKPHFAYDLKTDARRDAWDNEVLLVYVTDERVVYNWFWDDADSSNPNLPINHDSRFKRQVL